MLKFLFGIVGLMAAGCEPVNAYFGLQDDNLIENSIEDAIQYETGAQVDLTPSNKDEGWHLFERK